MLECVVNISEGRDVDLVRRIALTAGDHLLDVHSDPHHHRSVLTLAGPEVDEAAYVVAAAAVAWLDLRGHEGVHPRLGVVDVVPFVPLEGSGLDDAVATRDRLARDVGADLELPCFLYGPERSLPEVRRSAFGPDLAPDHGPREPHPTAGAACVGARPVLVAYNIWLAPPATAADALRVARAVRSPLVRTLGLDVGGRPQVSCNLIAPHVSGPAAVFDEVNRLAPAEGVELVGLLPRAALDGVPAHRWDELGIGTTETIEARLEQAGLDGGSSARP